MSDEQGGGRLRVAVVGCGPRAHAHLAAMRDGGAVEAVAVCDHHDQRLEIAGQKFGITRRYKDLAEMVRVERPEVVDVVTPPVGRVDTIGAVIDAGAKAVLIEKPVALKPSESRQLRELAREAFIAVNTQYPWMPHWRRFWEVLGGGQLGEVRTIRCGSRTNLIEQGPHTLDLALRAAELSKLPEPQWVMAAAAGLEYFGPVPAPADICAVYGLGDARLYLHHGPGAPAVPGEETFWYHIAVDVTGTEGRLMVTLNRGWQLWRRDADGKATFESGDTAWPRDGHAAQTALFAELRDRVRAGTTAEFPTRIEVAARNADLMFAAYASALGMGKVALPLNLHDTVVEKLKGLATPADFTKTDRTRERPRRLPPG